MSSCAMLVLLLLTLSDCNPINTRESDAYLGMNTVDELNTNDVYIYSNEKMDNFSNVPVRYASKRPKIEADDQYVQMAYAHEDYEYNYDDDSDESDGEPDDAIKHLVASLPRPILFNDRPMSKPKT